MHRNSPLLRSLTLRFRRTTLPLRRRLLGDRATVTVNGRRMIVNLADELFTACLYTFYLEHGHEPDEIALLKRLLRPGMTVCDVGANIGLHTVEISSCVGPEGRVIAFEPHPVNRDILRENCGNNHCTNVTIVPCAVSEARGEIELYESNVNYGDHRIYNARDDDRYNAGRARSSVRVHTVSLDEYAAEHGLAVDFIKSDIQGAEARLWRGMQRQVADRPHLRMLMEFWPYGIRNCGDDPEQFLAEMRSAGFSLYTLADGGLRRVEPAALLAELPGEHFTNILCSRDAPDA